MNQRKSEALILRDDRIVETVDRLQSRISERFPDSGLATLCGDLRVVAQQASHRAKRISRPILWIRALGYLLAILLVVILTAIAFSAVRTDDAERLTYVDFIQVFESGLNDVVFIGIAIYFLISFETRVKRRRALSAVHELRSIAHIIDMHQLTKDPERVLKSWSPTESSPQTQMTPFQLNRYLDYCSEMLALIGKIGSLYVQRFDDADSVAAVSELEQLSTGLSRKIWQKIIASRSVVVDGGHPATESKPPEQEPAGE